MRVGIPTFGSRVAPTFLHSVCLLFVHEAGGEVISRTLVPTSGLTEDERIKKLEELKIQTLICGGIDRSLMEELQKRGIDTINNVAGHTDEVLVQWIEGNLRPGYGISYRVKDGAGPAETDRLADPAVLEGAPREKGIFPGEELKPSAIDCVECQDRVCLNGIPCPFGLDDALPGGLNGHLGQAMDVAQDIAMEPERILCRVAELVYYCQGMEYKHVGVAFCSELFSEVEILTRVFRRFFKVTPVCCKVGLGSSPEPGAAGEDPRHLCNPIGMAHLLNRAATDINVVIGLCMGVDICVNHLSRAPVTTLFVKDRLLANNPIGAIYSKYQQEYVLSRI